jgi:tetratricopeptide (TPR) repeat protein
MHLPRTIAFAALLLLASCSSTDESGLSDTERLNLHREYAMKFFSTGEYAQAERQADLGLQLDDDEPELLLIKGWVHIKRGKTDNVLFAERVFRDLVKNGDFRARIGLGEALERKGVLFWDSAAAVESGERATPAADPVKRAEELRRDARKLWQESRSQYEQALAEKPSAIQAINGLQRVSALQGDHEAALAWSLKLLELSQQEIEYWRADLKRPNVPLAQEEETRRLLAGGEKLVLETHLQASGLLVTLGRKVEALAQLDAALALAPDRAEIYSRRAQLHRDLGQHQLARADIEQFLKRSTLELDHPDVQRALDLLSECEVALGKAPGS